jgi:hypothetical protein
MSDRGRRADLIEDEVVRRGRGGRFVQKAILQEQQSGFHGNDVRLPRQRDQTDTEQFLADLHSVMRNRTAAKS